MCTSKHKSEDWHSILDTFNHRQEEHIKSEFERFRNWLLTKGKDPEEETPLSESTADNYISRVKKYFKHVWQEEGYTTTLTHEQADNITQELNEDNRTKRTGDPYAEESKRKCVNSLEKYFQWRADERDGKEWEPPYTFGENHRNPTTDYFIKEGRKRIRDASLDYKSVPKYNNLSPEERDRWKAHIAQVRGKSKDIVGPDDWEYINTNYKWVSLFYTALDAALRPCEIERAKASWVRPSKKTLQIPKEDSAKNREDWEMPLREDTSEFLNKWIKQRENIQKYDETDALWLNQKENPYNSGTLNYHLKKLLQDIELEDDARDLTWYSIRHSTATYLNEVKGIAATASQLRHKSIQSTKRYTHPIPEAQREALNNIG